ncbi:MAG: purine-nucleoside phosphorylase [Firmicutes bacterium]|nr:purine-nucleoside phosphorylase [Bacillota bacterium]
MEYLNRIISTKDWLNNNYDMNNIELALVLGSGLGSFVEHLDNAIEIDFSDIPNFKTSKVEGHKNKLVIGYISGKKIIIMQGRIHYYEGNTMQEVTLPIRVLSLFNIKNLIITNAAGGLTGEAGQLMLIEDHLDLFCENPLIGDNLEVFGDRFPDMSNVYSKELIEIAFKTGRKLGINLTKGIYCYLTGPSYETPFDIKVLKKLGVNAVGMSTVPEVIVAKHSKMKVLGISCITNLAAGISNKPLSHAEVVETTTKVSDDFIKILRGIIEEI